MKSLRSISFAVVTSTSFRNYTVTSGDVTEKKSYLVNQTITYEKCRHSLSHEPLHSTQMLTVDRVFVSYRKGENMLTYAVNSQIGPAEGMASLYVLFVLVWFWTIPGGTQATAGSVFGSFSQRCRDGDQSWAFCIQSMCFSSPKFFKFYKIIFSFPAHCCGCNIHGLHTYGTCLRLERLYHGSHSAVTGVKQNWISTCRRMKVKSLPQI